MTWNVARDRESGQVVAVFDGPKILKIIGARRLGRVRATFLALLLGKPYEFVEPGGRVTRPAA